MPLAKKKLGQSDIWVSRLGLGTVKFGRNQGVKYPQGFELPSMSQLADLLAQAKALGVNLLDTAPAYGLSEARLGQLLKGQRQDWVIVGKAGERFEQGQSVFNFTPKGVAKSVENSLRTLGTDYLDVLLIHSDGHDQLIIEHHDVFHTLEKLKAEGKIRLGGISTKTVEGGLQTIAHSDVAMVTYHPGYDEELPVIQAAERQGKGILLKKAFASGHLDKIANENPVLEAMTYAFSQEGVTSVIAGTINPVHLQENVEAVRQVS